MNTQAKGRALAGGIMVAGVILVSCRCAEVENRTMPTDPFFGEITLQLTDPPESSMEAIRESESGHPPPMTAGAKFLLKAAQADANQMLKAPYRPRPEAYVGIAKESGKCDVFRARQVTPEGVVVHVAQTKYLMSIMVAGLDLSPANSDVAKAELAATLLLAATPPYRFERWGSFRSGSFGGRRITDQERMDKEWPHWLDLLRWWQEGEHIGFVTLKAQGGPTMEVISPDPEENRNWF